MFSNGIVADGRRGKSMLLTLGRGLGRGMAFVTAAALALAVGSVPLPCSAEASSSSGTSRVEGEALVVYHATGAAKGSTDSSPKGDGPLTTQSVTDDGLLLRAEGFAVQSTWDVSQASSSEDALSTQSDDGSAASGSDVRIALVSKDGASADDLVTSLEDLSYVECAAPNYRRTAQSLTNPDDPIYRDGLQYGLSSPTAGVSYQTMLDTDAASSARDNVVAVIDTGVDYTNPDLAGNMWTNPGGLDIPGSAGSHGYDVADLDDDPMPFANSECNHGTHCAGIVAACTNNSEGVAAIAQHTKIMAIKASIGKDPTFQDSALVSAFGYVIKARLEGVNVVAASNSWGGSYSPVDEYLVNQAGRAGILSVFAAGNEGVDVTDSSASGTGSDFMQSPYALQVASSNAANALSGFSNYDATAVDLAAPGSNILSTVSTRVGCFDAYLSMSAGTAAQKAAVKGYTDFSEFFDASGSPDTSKLGISLFSKTTDGDWTLVSDPAVLSHLHVTKDDHDGIPTCKVELDSSTPHPDGVSYYASLTWTTENPMYGLSDVDPATWAATVDAFETVGGTAYPNLHLYGSDGTDLSPVNVSVDGPDDHGASNRELAVADTTDQTLTASIHLAFTVDGWDAGLTTELTGFGMGPTSSGPSYDWMGGTSMAAPAIAGAVGELSSLHPDESALEIRGRIVGSTDPLTPTYDSSGNVRQTATDGRFSFANALGADSVSANSWSITCSGGTITLHGYALSDAALYVDDTQHASPVPVTSRGDDQITFEADAPLFDGKAHRFDVVDASTGKLHKASYVVPLASAPSYARAHELPQDVGVGASCTLVSATDRLFVTSPTGDFLYSCASPQDSSSAWEKLPAPGNPYQGEATTQRSPVIYSYLDGHLYATACDADGGATKAWCSVYDISSKSWSGYRVVGTLSDLGATNTTDGFNPTGVAWRGRMYLLTSQKVTNAIEKASWCRGLELCATSGQSSFAASEVPFQDQLSSYDMPMAAWTGSRIFYLSYVFPDEASAATMGAFGYDGSTWTDLGALSSTATENVPDAESHYFAVHVAVGNGLLSLERYRSLGDTWLATSDLERVELGSWLESKTESLTPTSAAMIGGVTYVLATDNAASTSAGALYTLPQAVASRLETTDVTASAVAQGAGTASVADWRGGTSSSIVMRNNDTATWSATAGVGSAFEGWYDEDGNLVSTDASYVSAERGTSTLAARFSTPSGPGVATAAAGTTDTTPSTGDGASPSPVLAALALVLLAAGSARRRALR